MSVFKTHPRVAHISAVCGIVIISFALIYGGAYVVDQSRENVVVQGVTIANVNVGGLTKEQAYARVSESVARFESKGVMVRALDRTVMLTSIKFSETTDATPLYEFDQDIAVNAAYSVGRQGPLWVRVYDQFKAQRGGMSVNLNVDTQDERMKAVLAAEFASVVSAPEETKLAVESGQVVVKPGVAGQMLMLDDAVLEVRDRLEQLSSAEVLVQTAYKEPAITVAAAQILIPEFKKIVDLPKFSFTHVSSTIDIEESEMLAWVKLIKERNDVVLSIDEDLVNATLTTIAPQIEKEAHTARFAMEDGKVKAFAPATQGISIDRGATIAELKKQWQMPGAFVVATATSPVITTITEPPLSESEVETMGIKELIAVGTTNFKGSPANRRHNIKTGVEKISGTLVAPGEEFSTIKTIGDIDGVNGFKEELVIKGDKTTPEFGGGLCQVSTTLFRSVLNGGLPITARRNHSYRVSYYEPPVGKDATIYFPNPDFKWVNDTGNHVLILGSVEGDNVTFELWGVKDGRTQVQTTPKVFNIIGPPPKKVIPTTTLAPGKVRCTEKPHAGATAVFNYTVTYPSGEVKDQEFRSVYRPWGEVCMVGIDPNAIPVTPELPTAPVDGAAASQNQSGTELTTTP